MLRPFPVVLAALLLSGCGDDVLVKSAETPDDVDRFQQLKASSIDILFVVDNSRSMLPHQEALAENFARFLEHLDPDPLKGGEPGEVDYRLAVASTDIKDQAGVLHGSPKVIAPGRGYDPVAAFQDNVVVGIEGAALEQGLRAAELALEAAGKLRDDKNQRVFLRENAFLYLIFLSDEDDGSFGEVRYYQRRFESIKGVGNENTILASAIAGPVPKGCATARPGTRYLELANLTGGVLGNLCTKDWSATLRELAFTGLGLRKRFQLKYPLDSELYDSAKELHRAIKEIRVDYPCDTPDDDPHLAGRICSEVRDRCGEKEHPAKSCLPYWDHDDGVTFDPRENTLVFHGAAVPGPGSFINVTYVRRGAR